MYLSRRAALGALLCLLPLFAACVGAANPEGWAPPVRDGEAIILSLDAGELSVASLAADGTVRVRWTFPNDNRDDEKRLEPEGIYGAPLLSGDRIYVATHAEGVFALNASDGTIAWRRDDLGDTIVSAFAPVSTDRLAVGTSDGRLHMLRTTDGKTAEGWPTVGRHLAAGIWATLVATADTLYAATMKGEVVSIDLATAQDRWATPFRAEGAVLDLALLPNGRLFVPSLDRHVHLVDASTGETVARVETADWVWMQPEVADGVAYFGDLAGTVYALDITSGEYRWRVQPDPRDGFAAFHRIKSRPLLLGSILVLADRAPAVHFLDASTGRRLNRVPIEASTVRAPLVASDTTALVLSTNGKLFRADPAQLSVTPILIGGAP